MKFYLLSFCMLLIAVANLKAQQSCMVDTTGLPADFIIFPEPYVEGTGGGISDTACVNQSFEYNFIFNTPSSYALGSTSLPIVSIDLATEGALKNLPTNFDYVCNPPNCIFKSDSLGCIKIFGTPAEGSEGVYDIGLTVLIRTGIIDLPFTFPAPDNPLIQGNYFLHVKEEGACMTTSTNDYLVRNLYIQNQPNPFKDFTNIMVHSLVSESFIFKVNDLMGKELYRKSVFISQGDNVIEFDGNGLSAGIYTYSLSNGKGILSRKMVVSR